jgi:hypothetical protein
VNVNIPGFGLGWLIALLVLVVCLVLWVSGHALSDDAILGLIAALAVARLVP